MKTNELTGMSDDELSLALRDTEKRLFQLRFQSATDRLETPSEIQRAKRTIARVKTIQRARELVRLGQLPDADIAAQLATLADRTDGPGKRRAKRAILRLETIQAGRPTAQGSGK